VAFLKLSKQEDINMVEKKTPDPLTLTPEMKSRLNLMTEDVNKARHAIEVLKGLGMETKAIEDKLEWAEQVRKTLLAEFGK
jgi:hypothetical protein